MARTQKLPLIWRDANGTAKVMAVSDKWAMMRRPGSIPFVVYVPDLLRGNTQWVPDKK